jgi:hypothetical protein
MIKYTFDEIRLLAQIYDEATGSIQVALNRVMASIKPYNYTELLEISIKEKGTPESSLINFLGAYDAIVYNKESWEMLHRFLFKEPIESMALHINDTGADIWKSKVAKWRLQINK